ncbi:MAG: aminoglycoside phosphotransferase family protein [Bacteroidales bacterium]|nr:aminoglycoside phosphotransferase family protein [Bacteroidales bacterium]
MTTQEEFSDSLFMLITVEKLKDIFYQFKASGTYHSGAPYGSGHIHSTFRIETAEPECDNYILQKLNNNIFKNIDLLQDNIKRVTEHIRRKLELSGTHDLKREVLTLINTNDEKPYLIDSEGTYWRMYIFIKDHRSYDIVGNELMAFEGGKAIGRFQAQLADLGDPELNETIPYFHDIEKRLESFHRIAESDPANRVKDISREIEFVRAREKDMKIVLRLGREGKIPLRITHNDTKFNNILLDQDDKALCVIDLDTVMPGYVHYDFGDAIRTAASSSLEDEPDLTKVYLDIDLFKAYTEGYLGEVGGVLNQTEIDYLAFAPRLITFIIGLRFLTDHIDGDNYFKIHHKHHNLQRARTQFKLVESNEKQYELMKSIIKEITVHFHN